MSFADNGKVFVVDNKRISITLKQTVLEALKLANEGKSAQEIKQVFEYLFNAMIDEML